MNGDKNIGTRI